MVLTSPTQRADNLSPGIHIPRRLTDKLGELMSPTVSFEYFPPKTEAGLQNLHSRIHSMTNMKPAWIDVTFGAGGSTSERTLEICSTAVLKYGVDVMIHLTCTNMKRSDIDAVLSKIHAAGIRNILALRGDPPANAIEWIQCEGGFSHAVDLVRYIRATYGDYFCIGVAGYPEGHTDCESFDTDLMHLKEKVDAGADMVITQLFYDNALFFHFLDKARDIGITCPIVPGVMPIMTFGGFQRMTEMCKTFVPEEVRCALDLIKDNEVEVKKFGVKLASSMCAGLLKSGRVIGVHLYTMNQEESVREIVRSVSHLCGETHTEWLRTEGA